MRASGLMVWAVSFHDMIIRIYIYMILAVSPRRAGGGSKTEQNERYGLASFSGLNV